MKTTKITCNYDSTGQIVLPVSTGVLIDKNDPVHTFNEVIEGVDLSKYLRRNSNLGRQGYNLTSLLKIVLFAFQINVRSTRRIAELCKHDIRFMWLSNYIRPSHNVIGNFIKHGIGPFIDDIQLEINKYIFNKDNVDINTVFIDGTKIEANANRYSFVWKKSTLKFRKKLYDKITKEVKEVNKVISEYHPNYLIMIQSEYTPEEVINIKKILDYLILTHKIPLVYGKGKRKTDIQRCYDNLIKYCVKLLEYKEHLNICGPDRNSYSKTDHDATFMRMKEDHMLNGQLKPGYNIQIAVADEYIVANEVFQDRSDAKTFIPVVKLINEKYKSYPQFPVADAGYGSYDTYKFCKDNGMELYQKYVMYSREKETSFKKKIFNSRNFAYLEDGSILCPNNQEFTFIKETVDKKGIYPKIKKRYKCFECNSCDLQTKCTSAKDGYRSLEVVDGLKALEKEAKANLDSPLGIELRKQRSIQVEGAFGVIKQDYSYRRLARKKMKNVKLEISLVCIGYNLSKYHNKKHRTIN
jgi:transposase